MKKIHRFYNPFKVAKELFKGHSLLRVLFNESIQYYKIDRKVLDLGSKSMKSPYYQKLQMGKGTDVTFTDLFEGEGVVKLNVEEKFPFEDNSFDYVISFHLFEHVFNFQNSASEIYRVLKPGGKFIVSVPFIHQYHADPDDYFRFTDSAIVKTWESSGLKCESMEYIGEGFFSYAFTTMLNFLKPNFIKDLCRAFSYIFFATLIDRLINKIQSKKAKKTIAQLYALEHIAVFQK